MRQTSGASDNGRRDLAVPFDLPVEGVSDRIFTEARPVLDGLWFPGAALEVLGEALELRLR
jgi:hypothetical protein